jgi:hypothetical protein
MARRTPLLPLLLLAALAACGKVETIPSSSLTDPPTHLFFNGAGSVVRLQGTAVDSSSAIKTVEVSLDGGANWVTVPDANLARSGNTATWHLDVGQADIAASPFTLQTRATNNGDKVEPPGPGVSVTKVYFASPVPSDLSAVFNAAYASTRTIYLGSGVGGAYRGTESSPLLLVNQAAMVLEAAVPAGDTVALAATPGAAYLFSLGASLTLKGVEVRGAKVGISAAPPAGGTLTVEVGSCAFASQARWALQASGREAHASSLVVALDDCTVDATARDTSLADYGGVKLKHGSFSVTRGTFLGAVPSTEIRESAALYLEAPAIAAFVDSCLFSGNAYPLKCSSGSPVISSCRFLPGASISNANGVLLRGGSSGGLSRSPVLRRNRIEGNGGFGVKVQGYMTPVLYRNRITGNGRAGVLVDGPGARPNLGDGSTPALLASSGRNDIYSNTNNGEYPGEYVEVQVNKPPLAGLGPIRAQYNCWGLDAVSQAIVWGRIQDGRNHPDGRATVDSSLYQTPFQSGLVGP